MRATRLFAFLAVVALVAAAGSAPASQKHSLTVEDMWKMARVADPQVSPDGGSMAFTVSWYSMNKNRGWSRIYVDRVDADAQAKVFTNPGDAKDWHPRWSPDGKTIAFLSTRSGQPQIWAIPANGGEARQVTDFPTGAFGFEWSPDGTRFAFISEVWPECGSDTACLDTKLAESEGPVQAKIIDGLLYRVWNSWHVDVRSHVFVTSADGQGGVVDLTPWDHDAPPVDLGSQHDFVWSPDGEEIAFVMNATKQVAYNTQNDVWIVPAKGGDRTRISPGDGADFGPLYSPDGKWIAYLSMRRPGFEADNDRLALYDRESGKVSFPAEDLDISIHDYVWAPDSQSVYFWAPEKGHYPIWRMDVASGEIEKIVDSHVNMEVNVTPDGKSIVWSQQAVNRPANVWRLDLSKKKAKPVQLTWFNKDRLERLEMNPVEDFWFEGAKGDNVHGFLLKPPGFAPGKKYPTVFLLHGGPQGMWTDSFHYRWNAQMFASPGWVVVMIDFHGSKGYGQAFCDDVSEHWGTWPYEDVMKGVDHVTAAYPFVDGDRLGGAGASYGGYLANWIVTHNDRFKAMVSHAGVYDLRSMYGATEELWFPEWEYAGTPWENPEMYEKHSPSFYIENAKTPTLVTHGANDFRVPFTQGMQFYNSLQRLGVTSKFIYFPDEDHFIAKPKNAQLWWNEVIGWLDRYMNE
jgi:dipeptidyl aminopeptidase/acylaminoacyl peptidase